MVIEILDAVRFSCRRCGKSRQSDSIAACAALESDMAHIFGFERSQLLLLPETVDDYVGADNPVRFIDAFLMSWISRRRDSSALRRRRRAVPATRRAIC